VQHGKEEEGSGAHVEQALSPHGKEEHVQHGKEEHVQHSKHDTQKHNLLDGARRIRSILPSLCASFSFMCMIG
jgi:hypothetical protein